MLCARCGHEIEEGTKFCRFCGAPATPAVDPDAVTRRIPVVDPDAVTRRIPPIVPVVPPVAPPAPASGAERWEIAHPSQAWDPSGSWDPSQSWERPEPPRRRTGMWAFVAGLVLVVCAGAAIAAYLLLRDDSGSASTVSTDTAGSATSGSATTVLGGEPTDTTTGEVTTTSADPVSAVDLSPLAGINVSSTLATSGSTTYIKANLIDGDPATCWAEGVAGYGLGEFVEFAFAAPVTVTEIRMVPGYDKIAGGWDRWTSNGRVRTFDLSFSDGATESYSVTDTRELQIIALNAPHTVTKVRLTITGVYEAAEGPNKAEDTSVSELHFWGTE